MYAADSRHRFRHRIRPALGFDAADPGSGQAPQNLGHPGHESGPCQCPRQGRTAALETDRRLRLPAERIPAGRGHPGRGPVRQDRSAQGKRRSDPGPGKALPDDPHRSRGSHDALDGKIFDKNDPFLKTHTPPWEFNCRCWLEEITAKEAGDNVEPLTKPEDVCVESESGFAFDPEEGLGTFDLTGIKDDAFREDTAEQLESRFEMSISPDGKYASLPTDTEKIEREPNVVGEKVQKAVEVLKKSGHIKTVDFSRTPESASENVKKASDRIAQRVEEYGLDVSYVGTHYHSRDMGKTGLNPDTVFETRERNGRTEFVFNEKLLANPLLLENIRYSAETGYHPEGCNSIAAYADHDIAHLLFHKARMDENVSFMSWINLLYHRRSFVETHISGYAAGCIDREDIPEEQRKILFAQEVLAECWASVKNSSVSAENS